MLRIIRSHLNTLRIRKMITKKVENKAMLFNFHSLLSINRNQFVPRYCYSSFHHEVQINNVIYTSPSDHHLRIFFNLR